MSRSLSSPLDLRARLLLSATASLLVVCAPVRAQKAEDAFANPASAPSPVMDDRKALQELFKDKSSEDLHRDMLTMYARRQVVTGAAAVCTRVDPEMGKSVNELKETWLDHNRDYLTVANVAFDEFSAQIEKLAGAAGKENYRQRILGTAMEAGESATRQYLDGTTVTNGQVPSVKSCNRFRDQISSGRMDFVFSPETTIELKKYAARKWPSMKL